MNKGYLLKSVKHVWFIKDESIYGKHFVGLYDIKNILEAHPQLMYSNFFTSSLIIEDKIKFDAPMHQFPVEIEGSISIIWDDPFQIAYSDAEFFARKLGTIRFDTLLMKDTTEMQGINSHAHHCLNYAVAIGVISQNEALVTNKSIWKDAFHYGLSPNDAVHEYAFDYCKPLLTL